MSSPQPSDAVVERFFNWARSRGIETSAKLSIAPPVPGDVGRGRRVVCCAPITKGEVLVLLPADAALSVEAAPSAAPPPTLAPLAGWWARHPRSSLRLAAALIWERERFDAYVAMLPELEDIDAPWRWPDEELRFVSEGIAAGARARRAALEAACADLEASGHADRVPPELFLRAQHAAASRAFSGEGAPRLPLGALLGASAAALAAAAAAASLGAATLPEAVAGGATALVACGFAGAVAGGGEVLSLLPMVDQVNHASGDPPDLQFDSARRLWELRAERQYKPGEEVAISYGAKDSDALLVQHGFVEGGNKADALTLPLPDGLPADAAAAFSDLGIRQLRFVRGGRAVPVLADGKDDRSGELPAAALEAAATAAVRAALASGDFDEAGDQQVQREVSSPARGELILRWRRERRGLLAEAGQLLGVR